EESTASETKTDETADSKIETEGQGNKAEGEGSFGYDIDWGGKGQRKILYYFIPDYPAGVQKEADIRLKFTILPDGSVGTIFPLTKADTRLENSAINALRQWSFEPLGEIQKQMEQTAVIVFPYRLQ
ncbi:MAG: energy transducer TonB, partial [Ignavibacteria bacterium]